MSQPTVEQKVAQWNEWLGTDANAPATVYKELVDLAEIRYVFAEVHEMIHGNPALQQHSAFYEVFSLTYAHAVAMYIRRQVRTDGHSLRGLLGEIKRHADLVTLEWYIDLYTSGASERMKEFQERNARGVFAEHFAGNTAEGESLDPDIIQSDIDQLGAISKALQDFVNWRVAHAVMKEPSDVPTYRDLDDWAILLEDLLKKYLLLLQGSGLESVTPVLTHGWQDIFRVAWLPGANPT